MSQTKLGAFHIKSVEGKSMEIIPEGVVRCVTCGKTVPDTAYCIYCAAKIKEAKI